MPNFVDLDLNLLNAVKNNNTLSVNELLKIGAKPCYPELLHTAIDHKNSGVVAALLKAGANRLSLQNGFTPIQHAAKTNAWNCVSEFTHYKYLEKEGVDSVLFDAVDARDYKVVEDLLKFIPHKKLPIKFINDYRHGILFDTVVDSALHHAVANNDPTMIYLLRAYDYPSPPPPYYSVSFKAWKLNFKDCEDAFDNNYFEYFTKVNSLQTIVESEYASKVQNFILKLTKEDGGETKKTLFQKIKAIQHPIIRQKALWQALDETTFLGQIFSVQRGFFKPDITRGYLKKVFNELILSLNSMSKIHIDESVKTNLLANLVFRKSILYSTLNDVNLSENLQSNIVENLSNEPVTTISASLRFDFSKNSSKEPSAPTEVTPPPSYENAMGLGS